MKSTSSQLSEKVLTAIIWTRAFLQLSCVIISLFAFYQGFKSLNLLIISIGLLFLYLTWHVFLIVEVELWRQYDLEFDRSKHLKDELASKKIRNSLLHRAISRNYYRNQIKRRKK